jgi:oxygen-independent coproporphyrinogen-3 oxidase
VNRLSLGVQSLRDDELKFLGRGHSATEAISAIKLTRKIFPRYSFDLIYARPNQTAAQWNDELSEALELAGEHLSLYQLTIEENTAFYHAYAKGGFAMPSEELAEELYRLTEEKMLVQGFFAYEVSNYAKIGEESRHNLSYWNGTSYVGIGAGAHGRINTGGKRIATQALKSPERWLEKVKNYGNGLEIWQEISPEIGVEERIMMGLRLREGINYDSFFKQTGYDLRVYINLKKRDFYIEQGLLASDKNTLKTTLKGRLLLNKLTAELLDT